MKRIAVLFAAVVLAIGCQSTSTAVGSFLQLDDGSIHSFADAKPNGFYVTGDVLAGNFFPSGDVRGEGTLATNGLPGWMELSSGKFFGAMTARAPLPPYVEGYRLDDGRFVPSTRRIMYTAKR